MEGDWEAEARKRHFPFIISHFSFFIRELFSVRSYCFVEGLHLLGKQQIHEVTRKNTKSWTDPLD
jgi:hypothetical protein